MKKIILPPLILFLALLLILLSACTYPMGSDLIETRESMIASIPTTIELGKKELAIAYTDENENEDFIFKTDRNIHTTWNGDVMSWMSGTNLVRGQVYYLLVSFGDGTNENGQYLRSMEMFMGNKQECNPTPITATTSGEEVCSEVAVWEELPFDTFNVKETLITRKDTKGRIPDKVFKVYFKKGETKIFRAVIRIPLSAKSDEWFWEAFGDGGAYGNLDPNNWVATEGFESCDGGGADLNGDTDCNYTWSGAIGFNVISTDNPAEGLQHVYFSNEGGEEVKFTTTGIVSGTVYISMKAHLTTTSQPKTYISTDGSESAFGLKLDNSGDLETISADKVGSYTYSADTYLRVGLQLEMGAGSYEGLAADTYNANASDGAWDGPYSMLSGAGTEIVGMVFQGNASGDEKNYWDWINPEYGAAPVVVTPTSEESDWIIYN